MLSHQPESGRCSMQVILLNLRIWEKSENKRLRGPPGATQQALQLYRERFGAGSWRVSAGRLWSSEPNPSPGALKTAIIILAGDPKTTREVLCGRCLAQHHLVEESWGEKGFLCSPFGRQSVAWGGQSVGPPSPVGRQSVVSDRLSTPKMGCQKVLLALAPA